jgi:hypothetical protein
MDRGRTPKYRENARKADLIIFEDDPDDGGSTHSETSVYFN